jgi:phosphohistidine phosphatase
MQHLAGMKTLLLLRHAKSSWADESLTDHQRPLNDRGKRDAPRVGELLIEHQLRPQVVLSSSAKRARKTAEKVIRATGLDVELRLADELYLAEPRAYVAQLQILPDDLRCVLIVGHNPGLEELCLELTGRHEQFPTAALAQIELTIDRWADTSLDQSGHLVGLWKP